jgi:hypothetical protein
MMVTCWGTEERFFRHRQAAPGVPSAASSQRSLDYDLAPDGKRFAVFLSLEALAEETGFVRMTFPVKFCDELRRRRVPVLGKNLGNLLLPCSTGLAFHGLLAGYSPIRTIAGIGVMGCSGFGFPTNVGLKTRPRHVQGLNWFTIQRLRTGLSESDIRVLISGQVSSLCLSTDRLRFKPTGRSRTDAEFSVGPVPPVLSLKALIGAGRYVTFLEASSIELRGKILRVELACRLTVFPAVEFA